MSWLSVAPVIFSSLMLLLLPGIAIGLGIGLRSLWLFAVAPVISLTAYGFATIVLPLIGMRWEPLPVLAFVVFLGLAIVLLFRLVLHSRFDAATGTSRRNLFATIFAWMIGGGALSTYFLLGIETPENISQTFDNVFHLNAIAFIHELGSASPLDIGLITAPNGGNGAYPAAWHAIVSLIAQATGASIPVAINSFNLVVVAAVWPVGMILLARQFAGRSTVATIAAGVLSAAFAAGPMHMLHYGVLYPYFLGLCLVPATVAVLLQLLGLSVDSMSATRSTWIVLFLGLLPATLLTHPGTTMVVLAFSVPIAVVACFIGWSSFSARTRTMRVCALALFGIFGFIVAWRLSIGDVWGPRMQSSEALAQTLTLSLNGYGFQLSIMALACLGAWYAIKNRSLAGFAGIGILVVALSLYFVTLGVSNYWLRLITRLWYGDSPRLGAIVPIAVIPLAVLGVVAIANIWKHRRYEWILTSILLVLVFGITQLTSGMVQLVNDLRASYSFSRDSALLSSDEKALLDRLQTWVDPDEMVAGSPWTGAALAYALSDRHVVFTHMFMTNPGADRDLIMADLRNADTNPQVCEALERLNVRWVLDFGDHEVHGGKNQFAGLEALESSGAVELVDSEGEATLYRIVAC